MLLRRAEERDIPSLQEIEKAARSRYEADGGLAFAAETAPIAARRLEEGEVIVAEEGGRPVGFILTDIMDGMLYIANISVDVAAAGRGIGAALIGVAEQRAISAGLCALALTTFKTPGWNGPWFRRLGFETMPDDKIGPGLLAVLERQRQFLDMTTRETLWRPVAESTKR